uniref:Atos-like conserved domain-containing protein n=1 Tax=Culex tarsalis TaxID=7177 RepID=A0A1Q3F5A3_CULTA
MHSGSFISPKHPAIPVSIGIASIVLEGRPAVIDGGTTTSSSSSSSRTTGSDGGGTGPGGGGGGGSDEDGGFCASGGAVGTECHPKSFSMTDAAKRINLKLQQIRSCPGTSKDVVENMVTVEAGAASGGEYDNYGVETYVSEARSSETTPLMFSAKAWSRDHIYSGFEKMKLMGAVSPIKVPPAAAAMSSFINFSGTSTVNSKKKLEVCGGGGGGASKQRTREGPHCEQFLKKVGVIKIDPTEEAEHSCSYRNEFCLRWQSYLKQLSSLLTTGEAICIEVYIGPENDAILLEQWILKLKIKSSDSTMTLQSLCAAIRSQLYFSQISAWTDLIKNSLEPEIFNHPRIKKTALGSVGVGGSSNETSPLGLPRAKLDILFRIRGYDNTACFNETPNVHNFPDAIVADNYVIEVVLKSLPRLERIPRIKDEMDTKMDETTLVNDRIDGPCHEKGKHRCTFRVEDEEDPQMGEEESAAMSHREKQLLKYKKRMMKREKKKKALESGGSTSSVGSNDAVPMVVTPPVCKSPALNIPLPQGGHANQCGVPPAYTSSINLIQPPLYSNCDDLYQPASCASTNNNNNTKATQTAIFLALSSSGTVSTVATQTDASGCCCLCANPQPTPPEAPTCTNSDSKMQYSNSNNLRRDYTTSGNCDTSQPEVDAVVAAAAAQRRREESKGLRKAELLLQAIQRTAIINEHHQPTAGDDDAAAHFSNNNYYSGSYNDNNNVGSDTAKCERSECDTFTFSKEPLDLGDCRLCKRQKTKHNFKLALSAQSDSESGSSSGSGSSSTNNSPPGCRRTLSESLVGHFTLPSPSLVVGAKNGAVKRDSKGADDDDDGIDDLSEGRLSTSTGAVGTLSFEQLKSYRRAFSEDVIDTISLSGALGASKEDFQQCGCVKPSPKDVPASHRSLFATPHVASRLPPTSTPAAGSSKTPLFVNCTESDCSVSTASSVSPHKRQILSCTAVSGVKSSPPPPPQQAFYTIPKINLSNIFNVSPLAREDSGFASTSSPIPIDESGGVFNFSESSRLMVQKSSSAPTCHLSPGSLSPRFLRHAYKHQRSRYLSERSSVSERSSIGSDEQLSEDEYPFLVDSNGTSYGSNFHLSPSTTPLSPLKFGSAQQRPFSRSFSKNLFKFGRSPLLGTLEESLLQRRIVPKFQVADFKVLLGASGSFCPTQLTIPVASYFYELPGQHLSTPYVCELRLPRKGYSIPRQGTVQVTLLNPLGTVVRMFVVPYDFRDMPAMSTTFIRQRILAYDDSSSSAKGSATAPQPRNVEQLSNAEQMKLLRYAIHLRFQTSRSGKLSLHTDIRLLISRRTDCDTAAAHAKNLLEAPNELKVVTIVPDSPKFSQRMDKQ